jgi:hypothetical protein
VVSPGLDRKKLARSTEDAVRRMTVAALSGRIETVPFGGESR